MTPQLVTLILTNLGGAALFAVIVRALGNRIGKQKRRLLPIFVVGAMAGFLVLILNLQQLLGFVWFVGAICGYAAQRKTATRG